MFALAELPPASRRPKRLRVRKQAAAVALPPPKLVGSNQAAWPRAPARRALPLPRAPCSDNQPERSTRERRKAELAARRAAALADPVRDFYLRYGRPAGRSEQVPGEEEQAAGDEESGTALWGAGKTPPRASAYYPSRDGAGR